jgi:hypothetical protein
MKFSISNSSPWTTLLN